MFRLKKEIQPKLCIEKYFPLKTAVALSAFLFASLMVLGNTYAWFVSQRDKTNHFEGTSLPVKIVEDFISETKGSAGELVVKRVAVKNVGETSAFVRISLYEYLLTFQVDTKDQTGNGNLALSKNVVTPTVDFLIVALG